jgi:uncharacterized protein YggU (UPF0235/DUF167 family)
VSRLDVRAGDRGTLVTARVRPRSRPGLELHDGGLVVRVASAPEKGRATEEARRALAEALDVAASRLRLVRGATSRTKVFEVSGLSPVETRTRLLALAE